MLSHYKGAHKQIKLFSHDCRYQQRSHRHIIRINFISGIGNYYITIPLKPFKILIWYQNKFSNLLSLSNVTTYWYILLYLFPNFIYYSKAFASSSPTILLTLPNRLWISRSKNDNSPCLLYSMTRIICLIDHTASLYNKICFCPQYWWSDLPEENTFFQLTPLFVFFWQIRWHANLPKIFQSFFFEQYVDG